MSLGFNNQKLLAVPPEKGSFPLDREGLCKEFFTKYMLCARKNGNNISLCREESKNYLECRMEKDLMKKEELNKLGFSEFMKENENDK